MSIGYAAFFIFLGVLPQLIYWQIATGFFIYDVGSKWSFLNPFFSVLFGFESGWFIYTPITIFFIVGMFYMTPKEPLGKSYPFKKAVLWFCLLNIYIIISWFDGNPDATYSCRRLVQSYSIFALPLAAFIERINYIKMPAWQRAGKFVFYALGLYLIGVNLFQIGQYNKTILHYTDMNRPYYERIYLNPHPTPLDMSLLDTNDYLGNVSKYNIQVIAIADTAQHIQCAAYTSSLLLTTDIKPDFIHKAITEAWLKIEAEIKVNKGFGDSYLYSEFQTGDSVKRNKVRLFSPISKGGDFNKYAFYIKIPDCSRKNVLRLYIHANSDFDGLVENIKVTSLMK